MEENSSNSIAMKEISTSSKSSGREGTSDKRREMTFDFKRKSGSSSRSASSFMRESASRSNYAPSIPLSIHSSTRERTSRGTRKNDGTKDKWKLSDAWKGSGKQFKSVITQKTFLISAVLSIIVAGVTCVCLAGSIGLFRFMANIVTGILCLQVFIMLCFSQITGFIDGFFLAVGMGYGFAGAISILTRAALYNLLPADDNTASVYQLDLFARYNELAALFIGIAIASKTFRGMIPMIITFFLFLFVNAMLFCSIYWWRTFPVCFDVATKMATPFFIHNQYAFIALFIILIPFLFTQRRYFSNNVFVFVTFALLLRAIATIFTSLLAATTADWPTVLTNLFRVISFVFLFISLSISTLKNPMETLYKNLTTKHDALQDERVVINWMIEQVPAIAILITDDGNIQHINRFGLKALDLGEKRNIVDSNFFATFSFEDVSTEDAIAQFKNIRQNSKTEMNPLRTNKLFCNGGSAENHIIEWTFKPMTSSNSALFTKNEDEDALSDARSESSSKKAHSEAKSSLEHSLTSSTDGYEEDEQVATTFLCLGRDITDKHEREKLLNEAREKAEKASLMKDAFVANVSHELRTPLNCIVGVTDLFQQMPLSDNQQEMVSMIKGAANALLNLISDILDFAKLRQGQMKLTYAPFDLYKFVETSVASMSILFSNNLDFGYRIQRNCPKMIYNDETRLRQILFNLFSNSIKFTPEGQVVLHIQMSEELIGGVPALQFEVQDSGIGIDEADQRKLFERFFQSEQGENKKPGTGIGLAITKQIVELMGGKISVTSKKGVGTTMRFIIPSRKISIKSAIQSDSPSNPLSPEATTEKKSITWESSGKDEIDENDTTPKETASAEKKMSRSSSLKDSFNNYPEAFDYKPVFLCLKNQVVSNMLEQSLNFDYSIPTTNAKNPSQLMKLLLNRFAPHLVADFNHSLFSGSFLSPSGSQPSDPVPSTPDVPAPSASPEARRIAHTIVPSSSKEKKANVVSIVLEVDFLGEINWKIMEKLQNDELRVQLLVVVSNSECTLPPTYAFLEKEFKVEIIRKMIQQSLLIKTLRRGQRKLMMEHLDLVNDQPQKEEFNRRLKNQLMVNAVQSSDEDTNAKPKEASTILLEVLVVEDNKTNQRVMQLMLDRIGGVKYEFAANGREAVDMYSERMKSKPVYDCIFMDIQMPILDGIGATLEIRKIEKEMEHPITHITALTANALQEEKEKCKEVGMNDFLVKPVGLQTFTNKIDQLRQTKESTQT
eukprot:TRINITY_DN277_c0_g1_i1.p1 TRINITY_DN277_c0_g1~~TRINITY_DN277_c0_g1_i1.p1  ORF type:complete len:1239 (-),score=461.61 TRINITY_DN277_c0_g1_i1:37-3753(-)